MFLVLLAHDQHGSFVRPLVQEEPVAHMLEQLSLYFGASFLRFYSFLFNIDNIIYNES